MRAVMHFMPYFVLAREAAEVFLFVCGGFACMRFNPLPPPPPFFNPIEKDEEPK